MKSLMLALLLLLAATAVWAQTPDPRDSIILESKTVTPGAGRPYMTVKVYVTNRDSLVFLALSLLEKSTSGGAYGILERTTSGILTFNSVITNLTPSLRYGSTAQFRYNNSSPDSFFVVAGYDGSDPNTIEPPNATRKAIWEIKFDTVLNNAGAFELDTVHHPFFTGGPVQFTNTTPVDMPAHFVKSVITVAIPPKGDFNRDLRMSASDVVILLTCVFSSIPPPGAASCDMNCDGELSASDVVLELQAVFLEEPFPC